VKIVVAGGTGQLGSVLCRALHAAGHEVVVLSRHSGTTPWRVATWDAATPGPWIAELDGADALVNLVGRSVNCRYNAENRRLILSSRIDSTRVLGAALGRCTRPPHVWLQSSTATIYTHRYDAANDEATGLVGGNEPDAPETWRFSIDVATSWERTALEASHASTRLVLLRTAFTMSPDPGGVFDVMLWLVRRGLGGTLGDGRQYVSWIHDADFIRILLWAIDHPELRGPLNVASPQPLPNAEFMRVLRDAWGTRFALPVTRSAWLLELGAIWLETETELVLKSRRVAPGRLLETGFRFEFPDWRSAAADLCRRWRRGQRGGEPGTLS
jgi:uncharacterized protein (TIGR01777 family)